MRFYLGTYTKFGGPGVALCGLTNGTLRVCCADTLTDPTYVILNKAQDRLFAVSSANVDGSVPGGSVASYDVSQGRLIRLSHRDTSGAGACYLCLSEDERYLYTANYGGGSLSVFPVDRNGCIAERVQLVQHEGYGPNTRRQLAPHVHQVSFIPGTNRLCAVDLGTDEVRVYARDRETGLLALHDCLKVPGGLGPRHICYGENGLAYLVHEVESQVSVLLRENDAWTLKQTLPTLSKPDDSNAAAAIRLNKMRLYVSNRGQNSLAVYTVSDDGQLSPFGFFSTGDDFPRDFDFVSEDELIITHQKGEVSLCRISDAGLTVLNTLAVKGAVCVCVTKETAQ